MDSQETKDIGALFEELFAVEVVLDESNVVP